MNPNAAAFVPGTEGKPGPAAISASLVKGLAKTAEPPLPETLTDKSGVVSTEAQVIRVIHRLSKERLLCVDCEGADLSKGSWRDGQLIEDPTRPLHGRLCLMQFGLECGEVFALDILELGAAAFDLGLRQLLEDPLVTKVVHDFRQDADALWHQFRVCTSGLFDCQLADVLVRRLNGHRTTYVPGSARLLSAYGIEGEAVLGHGPLTQDLKAQIHARFSQDRHLWERRPIPADMVAYAKADVLPLPRLYRQLLKTLGGLLGDEMSAQRLARVGSVIYDMDFVESPYGCRCRLCCNAEESARFDGNRVFSRMRMTNQIDAQVIQRLWRPEDAYPMPAPGPSKYYVNEWDESVPLP